MDELNQNRVPAKIKILICLEYLVISAGTVISETPPQYQRRQRNTSKALAKFVFNLGLLLPCILLDYLHSLAPA
jgi:hypothetical protein